jgi:hypothetical protein
MASPQSPESSSFIEASSEESNIIRILETSRIMGKTLLEHLQQNSGVVTDERVAHLGYVTLSEAA